MPRVSRNANDGIFVLVWTTFIVKCAGIVEGMFLTEQSFAAQKRFWRDPVKRAGILQAF
jgi:hypothetical protein